MKKFLPVVILLLLVPSIGWSQHNVLQVSSLNGKVEIRSASSKNFQPLVANAVRQVQVGDEIHTGPDASVVLQLPDHSYMVVSQNTNLVIRDFWSGGSVRNVVNLMLGRVRFFIEKVGGRAPYRVQTPTALIAVRGTIFEVNVDSSQYTEVLCLEGQVGVENVALNQREVILNKDWKTGVAHGEIPLKPVLKNDELSPNRTLRVVKKGPKDDDKNIDPRTLEQMVRDNDRSTRPTDRYKTPASGTDSNVGRAKPGMTYPE